MKQIIITPENPQGILLDLTSEEMAQREKTAIKEEQLRQKELAEKQAKIDAKASALAKLSALGLTEEEVNSIL
jgi:phosphopantetheine adenylyltransferase